MSRRPRRNHSPAFKAKGALALIKAEKTLAELAERFDLHHNQITTWRSQLLEGAAEVIGEEIKPDPATTVDLKSFHAKIGDLTLVNDVFVRAARDGRPVGYPVNCTDWK